MTDRPGGDADPTVTYALRAMAPPDHGEAFWDRLDDDLRAESWAPTMAVPVAPPPPPPLAEVVRLPARRRSRPAAPWIAAAAALLLVAVAAVALIRTATTDVTTTPAATAHPAEVTTSAVPPPSSAPTTAGAVGTPATTAKPVPTTAVPRTTTTTRLVSLTLSPDGIGPLRLGMSPRQAKATGAAGAYEEPLGPACGFAGPAGPYRSGDFSALFLDGKLVRFYVSGASRLRTPQGIGAGSPVAALSAVPGTRVDSPHPYSDTQKNVEITTGGVGYLFTVEGGKVVEWSAGTADGLAVIEGCA